MKIFIANLCKYYQNYNMGKDLLDLLKKYSINVYLYLNMRNYKDI
jgi:hypothetical protein